MSKGCVEEEDKNYVSGIRVSVLHRRENLIYNGLG